MSLDQKSRENISKMSQERFFQKIKKTEACWIWTGRKNWKGYGEVKCNNKSYKSHRLSWIIHFGCIPEKMCILHKCDNPCCVNPNHLFLGTHQDNMIDMFQKGRGNRAFGTRVTPSKLNEEKVRSLRNDFYSGMKRDDILMKYSISKRAMYLVAKRITWKHVV
jgi:hypothetical protein